MKIYIRDRQKLNESIMKKGLTRRGFGKAIGLSHSTITQLLNGSRNPSPPTARKIVEFLESDFDEIFFIDDGYKSNQSA
jgi:DNA-binding XRE family transcriptional regulator